MAGQESGNFTSRWTMLLSMIALAVRVLSDTGLTTRKATLLVGVLGFLMGVPSALSATFFLSQNWVLGIGLIVSGAFFAFAVLRFDVARFRENYINAEGSDVRVGKGYNLLVRTCIPVGIVALIGWWFWVAIQVDPGGMVESFAGQIGGDLSPPAGNGSCILCVP